jgi:Glutathione-dependent formaldehyde-activating enzyme
VLTIRGKCRCGACSYEIAIDELPRVYACHCHICQRASGSAFSLQALVEENRLAVTGPIVVHEITTEDRSRSSGSAAPATRASTTRTRGDRGSQWCAPGRWIDQRNLTASRISLRLTAKHGSLFRQTCQAGQRRRHRRTSCGR